MTKWLIIWDGGKGHIRDLKERGQGGNVKKFSKNEKWGYIVGGKDSSGWVLEDLDVLKLQCMKFSMS